MKAEIREAQIWNRSAEKHKREGEPVAAMISGFLAQQAQDARDEFAETAKAAEVLRLTMLMKAVQ